MSAEDANNVQGQAAPADAGNATAGEPTNDAFERIPKDELNRLRSYEQQFRGSKPLVDAALSSGFKSPDDFGNVRTMRERVDRYGKLLDTLDKRKVNQDALLGLLDGGGDDFDEDSPKGGFSQEDIEKLLDERDKKRSRQEAESKHSEMSAREAKLARELANEILGDSSLSEFDKKLIADGLALRAFQNRKPYGDDHPLGGDYYAPHDEDSLKSLVAQLKDERQKALGEALAKKGDAARTNATRQDVTTVAGKSGAGKADVTEDDVPFAKRSPDAKRQAAEALLQRRRSGARMN